MWGVGWVAVGAGRGPRAAGRGPNDNAVILSKAKKLFAPEPNSGIGSGLKGSVVPSVLRITTVWAERELRPYLEPLNAER